MTRLGDRLLLGDSLAGTDSDRFVAGLRLDQQLACLLAQLAQSHAPWTQGMEMIPLFAHKGLLLCLPLLVEQGHALIHATAAVDRDLIQVRQLLEFALPG